MLTRRASGPGELAGRRERIGLALLALPALLVEVDITALFLALPRLSADLHASSVEQLWITDSYGFLVAGFVITMGTLGDRIGRRRLLLIGGAAFAAVLVAAACSVSPLMLIIARGALGIAGSTLAPSTMALISSMFRDTRQRGQAIAVWATSQFVGGAAGPVMGRPDSRPRDHHHRPAARGGDDYPPARFSPSWAGDTKAMTIRVGLAIL
jgi:DHA2 family multidrug resistance protein-like MFS transporter